MKNVLSFPVTETRQAPKMTKAYPADVIDLRDYKNRARPLRLATGVYFVSRGGMDSDTPSAA